MNNIINYLEEKEKKFNIISQYYEKYKLPIIVTSLNIPGNNKNNSNYEKALDLLDFKIKNEYFINENIILTKKIISMIGNYYLYLVDSNDADTIKIKCINIEEKNINYRIFDIDVFYRGNYLKRNNYGYEARKCFLCENNSIICRRTKNHTEYEILKIFNNLVDNFINENGVK